MRSLVALLLVVAVVPSCTPTAPTQVNPATVTLEQFGELRWITGSWRGAEGNGAPFFERYVMLDDSTIASTTWTDSTFSTVADSSIIHLRNGEVSSGSDAVATQWGGGSVHFEPRNKASNSYTWRTEGADRWTATLHWVENGQARERTYIMTRLTDL